MKKSLLTIFTGALAALLLSSCQPHAEQSMYAEDQPFMVTNHIISNDGYYIETTTQDNKEFYVRIIKYKSYEDLGKAWKHNGGSDQPKGYRTVAFSEWDDKTCTIHMVDPLIDYKPQYMGHELLHCMIGSFHPNQPK